MNHPNILLITIDCWRFDRFGKQTPNLQQLAEKGVVFQQAYTNGGWTQAAFPALLTSTYASMYDGCLGPLSDKRPYLPECLQERGYHTLAVQTHPLLDQDFGYGRGIDEQISLLPPWQAPSWYRIKGMQRLFRQSGFHHLTNAAKVESRPAPAYANADVATEQAIRLLQQAREPFFLWVHYMDAHWPYYDQEEHDSPEGQAQSWTDRQLYYLAVRKKDRQKPSSETVAHWVSMHDAALQSIDREICRLMDMVYQRFGEDILIIATGDHGEEYFEHGNFGHGAGSLYDEILHVPLIIVYPKRFLPSTIHQPIALLDIAPTIADLLSSQVPPRMLGDSLLPLICEDGSNELKRKPIISECHWGDEAHLIAIRANEYKYIIDLSVPEKWQLFNIRLDPNEHNNLRPETPEDAPELGPLLDAHLATIRASKTEESGVMPKNAELTARLRDLGYVD